MLSSRRALQISGTIVASLEKSIFLRYLQAPFHTLYSLAVSLLSQTSFGHISTNSLTIPTVLKPA